MNLLVLFALVVEVVVLSRLERGRITTRITPFNLLAFPYTVVTVIALFLAPTLDFVPVSSRSIVIWMVGLFVIWLTGMLLTRVFLGGGLSRRLSERLKSTFPAEASTAQVAMWLGIVAIPFLPYKLLEARNAGGGWAGVGSPEFKAAYIHGPLAHVVLLCVPIVILLLGTGSMKARRHLAVAGVIMFLILLGQAKGITLQPLIGGLFYRLIRGRAIVSLKSVGIVVLCGVLVFGAVDLMTWGAADSTWLLALDPGIYQYVGRHFCFYLMNGVLASSEAVRDGHPDVGGEPEAIFAPFVNLYRVAIGSEDLIAAGSTKGQGADIDLLDSSVAHSGNVFTFFGTLYLYLGPLGAIAYATVVGLACYLLLLVACGTCNELILVVYCFVASQLFFGFFELYFWYLSAFEIAFVVLFVVFVKALLGVKPRGGPSTSPSYGLREA